MGVEGEGPGLWTIGGNRPKVGVGFSTLRGIG